MGLNTLLLDAKEVLPKTSTANTWPAVILITLFQLIGFCKLRLIIYFFWLK